MEDTSDLMLSIADLLQLSEAQFDIASARSLRSSDVGSTPFSLYHFAHILSQELQEFIVDGANATRSHSEVAYLTFSMSIKESAGLCQTAWLLDNLEASKLFPLLREFLEYNNPFVVQSGAISSALVFSLMIFSTSSEMRVTGGNMQYMGFSSGIFKAQNLQLLSVAICRIDFSTRLKEMLLDLRQISATVTQLSD
ncbi:MAG: hypothetical protein EZS28_005308 [Streblomastix strix]|uniref:Uncharacterized protein n=1 Tax=Streblomastix strix TaxID=222440 RepID=A0A5J4WXG2_9EUKA|nr:MAG: hypothetical protein EZS28_005308 [Streblomastix strix]